MQPTRWWTSGFEGATAPIRIMFRNLVWLSRLALNRKNKWSVVGFVRLVG